MIYIYYYNKSNFNIKYTKKIFKTFKSKDDLLKKARQTIGKTIARVFIKNNIDSYIKIK